MIRSFKHKGLEQFHISGSKAGIIPDHAKRLRLILGYLEVATKPEDINVSGWALHKEVLRAIGPSKSTETGE
jgi:proteic killer suppression protein